MGKFNSMDEKGQKWMEMGEVNPYHLIHIYHCRQEALRRNAVALRVNRRDRDAMFE